MGHQKSIHIAWLMTSNEKSNRVSISTGNPEF